jgi:hypothetical protein
VMTPLWFWAGDCYLCKGKGTYGIAHDALKQTTNIKPPPIIFWQWCECKPEREKHERKV